MFLFSFDLIELNTFYNYFIYCLFIVLEYIFIAYYPLNQIYQNKTIYVLDASNTTLTSTGVNTILTYQEVEIYPKNFTGEYADTYIPSIV